MYSRLCTSVIAEAMTRYDNLLFLHGCSSRRFVHECDDDHAKNDTPAQDDT
jgi:hypothetical protein